MTRKDYELIARIFNKNINDPKLDRLSLLTIAQINQAVARQSADVFEKANPKFDKAKFLTACGVN